MNNKAVNKNKGFVLFKNQQQKNKQQQNQTRDQIKRLKGWEGDYILREQNVNSKDFKESMVKNIPAQKEFSTGKKMFGSSKSLFVKETQENTFKSSIKIIKFPDSKSYYENNFFQPKKQRGNVQYSQEMDIINQMKYELPHMRTQTPNQRQFRRAVDFKNSEELNIINQMHNELPSMRTKTPNNRQIRPKQQHILTNDTDFINQKKNFMPSFQQISYNPQKEPNKRFQRNYSQFSLKWE